MIGITLALPAGLFALLANVADLSVGWENGAQVSVYLDIDVSEARARRLAAEIESRADVVRVEMVTRADALEEYRNFSGFGGALTLLADNPLPHSLVVIPSGSQMTPASIDRLRTELLNFDEVEVAQFDLDWVLRLQALTEAARQGVLVLAALLAVAVILIIGNTIRMVVFSRRDEIEIACLFGATTGFVRRPFLYSGMLFGATGGLLGVGLVNLCFAMLSPPVRTLVALYSGDFVLTGLDTRGALALVILGAALGALGSWLAVGRYLKTVTSAVKQ